jgi:L-threonylcarbamoyladenylate synthase
MADRAQIVKAASVLKSGGLVALPTETVYGLGADALNEAAVKKVFEVKGRPPAHPLIVHIGRGAKLEDWASDVPAQAKRLAAAFWPGPLTLILKKHPRVPAAVTGGQETIALRVPDHPDALDLLDAFGGGIAAPSANRFGRVSPTTAQHVRDDLGNRVDFILDGGPCKVGVESTILDLTGGSPVILRPGGVTREVLEKVLGVPVAAGGRTEVRAPGTLESHYSPRARVRLETRESVTRAALEEQGLGRKAAAWLAAGDSRLPVGIKRFPVAGDAGDRARSLYQMLRDADAEGFDVVLVTLPPESGLDAAIVDRLRRAAGPRDSEESA